MSEVIGFFVTILLTITLILLVGKKRKSSSRYERTPYSTNDWQKLDRGIDPSE
jgi:hypothetical protein